MPFTFVATHSTAPLASMQTWTLLRLVLVQTFLIGEMRIALMTVRTEDSTERGERRRNAHAHSTKRSYCIPHAMARTLCVFYCCFDYTNSAIINASEEKNTYGALGSMASCGGGGAAAPFACPVGCALGAGGMYGIGAGPLCGCRWVAIVREASAIACLSNGYLSCLLAIARLICQVLVPARG